MSTFAATKNMSFDSYDRMMPLSLLAAVADTSDSDDDSSETSHHRTAGSDASQESAQSMKKRLARKAQLARESRTRKKHYIRGLEEQIVGLKQQVEDLQAALRSQNNDNLSVTSTHSPSLQTLSLHEDGVSKDDQFLSVKLHYHAEIRRFSLIKSRVTLTALKEKAVAYWPHVGTTSTLSVIKDGGKQCITDEDQLAAAVAQRVENVFRVYVDKADPTSRPQSPVEAAERGHQESIDDCPSSKRVRHDPTVSIETACLQPVALRPVSPALPLEVSLQVVENVPGQGAVVALAQSLSLSSASTFADVRQYIEQSLGTSLQGFVFVISGCMVLAQLECQSVHSLMQPQQLLLLCRNTLLSQTGGQSTPSLVTMDQ